MATFAKTFDVDISSGRPSASNEAYYHGETIEFRAVRGRSVVTNIEYSCVYYQTNGMDDVWWRTDGLCFHPTNDVGAASYRFFLEGRDDLGRDWHANGLLRLLPSPGFTPNTIELPVATLDFAAVDVLNPPWTDPDYSTNNTTLVATIEAAAPAPGNYATVSNAAMNAAITNEMQDASIESNRVSIESNRVNIASNAAAVSTLTDTTSTLGATNALQNAAIKTLSDTTSTLSDSISTLSDSISTLGDTVDEAYSLANSASDSAREALGTAFAASSDAQDASVAASAAQAVANHALILANSLQEVVDELAAPRRVAMFVIPVNEGGTRAYKGFELKCSTNNFASAASESVKLQFYSQSEIADEGSGSTIDKMKLFACTSYFDDTRDLRSYSPIGNTIDYGNDLYSVVALVDVSCLKRHPEDNGAWLSEDNEDLVWCYLRDTANDVEREELTTGALWRPIAPAKWFRELPSWAR